MKLRSKFRRREENFAEMKIFYRKCLAKDSKLSSFLGGMPMQNFNFYCYINFVKFCV